MTNTGDVIVMTFDPANHRPGTLSRTGVCTWSGPENCSSAASVSIHHPSGWWAACGRHGAPVALLASVKGQADPVNRAVAAGQLLAGLAAATTQAAEVRRAAVAELRGAGWSHADVATALGLSRGQAQSLAAGRSHSGTRQPV